MGSIRVDLDPESERKLLAWAAAHGVTFHVLASQWLASFIRGVGDPPSVEQGLPDKAGCLVPRCTGGAYSRGACPAHYQRWRYFVLAGKLNEAWCVRNGRILPRRGTVLGDYAGEDTLATLPKGMPDDRDDTKWLFDWPRAAEKRLALEKGVAGGQG